MPQTLNVFLSYIVKATDGKYYACCLFNSYEMFLEAKYSNLASKKGAVIEAVIEAFDKAKTVTIPAYKDYKEHTIKVIGTLKSPVVEASLDDLKALLK